MPTVNDIIIHCQKKFQEEPSSEEKILKYLGRLDNIRITVQNLVETGVGKTVNQLGRNDGEVGHVARKLVRKWKNIVGENSEESEKSPSSSSSSSSSDSSEDEDNEDENQNNDEVESPAVVVSTDSEIAGAREDSHRKVENLILVNGHKRPASHSEEPYSPGGSACDFTAPKNNEDMGDSDASGELCIEEPPAEINVNFKQEPKVIHSSTSGAESNSENEQHFAIEEPNKMDEFGATQPVIPQTLKKELKDGSNYHKSYYNNNNVESTKYNECKNKLKQERLSSEDSDLSDGHSSYGNSKKKPRTEFETEHRNEKQKLEQSSNNHRGSSKSDRRHHGKSKTRHHRHHESDSDRDKKPKSDDLQVQEVIKDKDHSSSNDHHRDRKHREKSSSSKHKSSSKEHRSHSRDHKEKQRNKHSVPSVLEETESSRKPEDTNLVREKENKISGNDMSLKIEPQDSSSDSHNEFKEDITLKSPSAKYNSEPKSQQAKDAHRDNNQNRSEKDKHRHKDRHHSREQKKKHDKDKEGQKEKHHHRKDRDEEKRDRKRKNEDINEESSSPEQKKRKVEAPNINDDKDKSAKSNPTKNRSSSIKEKSNSSKDKSSSSKEKLSSSKDKSSSSKDKSSSSKDKSSSSKEKPKKSTQPNVNINIDEEIDSVKSGVNFEELLGCLDQTLIKNTSSKKDSRSKSSKKAVIPSTSSGKTKEEVTKSVRRKDLEKVTEIKKQKQGQLESIIAPTQKLCANYKPSAVALMARPGAVAPLPKPPSSSLGSLSTLGLCDAGNYWEDTITSANKPSQRSDEDALAKMMASRNQRTKVFSGNKAAHSSLSTVPRLFDMCIQVIIENLQDLEYTGGVPYDVLKNALQRATAKQLLQIEECNPYLIGDTDDLWKFHCKKDFKEKSPAEVESWRELYERCVFERDQKFAIIRDKMLKKEQVAVPVRKAKLAYVEPTGAPRFNRQKAATIKNGMKSLKIKEEKGPRKGVGTSASVGFNNPTDSTRIVEEQAVLINPESKKGRAPAGYAPRGGGGRRGGAEEESASKFKPRKAPLMAKTMKFIKTLQRK